MKIQLISDLHLEHHKDGGKEFIKTLNPDGVDALVLAGDIGTLSCIDSIIELLTEKYQQIIMIAGNHEYYRSDAGNVLYNFDLLEEKYPNFHFLDNRVFELNNKRFLGATLWYPFASPGLTWGWSDFLSIRGFESWVYDQHKKSVEFFTENLRENDIVITHMLPSFRCIAPKYSGDPENVFFACSMDALIEDRKPKYWMHGHTHMHIDMKIGETRILANPRGYTMYGESLEETGFDDRLIIEI